MTATVIAEPRPRSRGLIHAAALIVAVPAGVLLLLHARGPAATAAVAIYWSSLLLVFGTSAGYHLLARSDRARQVMQRVDHAMIFTLIVGTYVPVCIIGLPARWGIPLLAIVGLMALVGITIKLADVQALRSVGYALYPATGWAAVLVAPALARHTTGSQVALIVLGGLVYTAGFPMLLLQRPDPWPATFGYHEVWHTFTVVAAAVHFAAVAQLAT